MLTTQFYESSISMAIEAVKNIGDTIAGFVTVAVLAKFIPIIAGTLSILWYLVRFYEWAERRFFKKLPSTPD